MKMIKFFLNENFISVNCNGIKEDVPVDWVKNNKLDNLSNICQVKGGKAFKANQFLTSGICKVIKIKNVGFGEIKYDNLSYISTEEGYNSSAFLLKPLDIIISMTGSGFNAPNSLVGRVAIVNDEDTNCYMNQRVGCLNFLNPVSAKFWFYFMSLKKNQHYLAKNATGSANQVNISNSLIESINIPFISLIEQEKIANILSAQDAVILKTKILIENIEKRNKFMMTELLTGRLRIKEKNGQFIFYKNPESDCKSVKVNGEYENIPNDWEKCFLGSSVVPFVKSGVKAYDGNLDYYATGEVEDFSLGVVPTGNFTYDEKPSRANLRIFDNTIYLARMKNTLKIIKFKKSKNILLSTGFLGLIPNTEKVSLDYLYFISISKNFQTIKDKECKGSTQESLSDAAAANIEILLPDIKEQEAIAKILEKLHFEQNNYIQILEKEQKTFTFLLEELMSGRLRVET